MITTRWMMSLSLVLGLCVSTAVAQDSSQFQLRQPGSVQQVAYDYGDYYGDYYAEDEQTDEPQAQAAPVPVNNSGYANTATIRTGSYDSCGGCDSCNGRGGCDSCDSCGSNSCDWCCLGDAFELYPATRHNPFTIGGWMSAGYHDAQTPLSRTRGDLRAYNDVPDNVNMQQMWLYAEKQADGRRGWDWGFRGDMMYGTDAQKIQAFGQNSGWDTDWDNGVYGWAIPQAYVELASGDFSVIAGRFFTIVGYEGIAAPNNFFYSRSLTTYNSEPFTHTGVLGTYDASDAVTVYGGWTAGWDTGFTQNDDGSMFLGGFSLELTDSLMFTYIGYGGNMGWRGSDGYGHSLVLNAELSDRWNYVLQSDYVRSAETRDDDVSINQFLFYSVNDCVAVGGRLEWWEDDGTSYYEATGGINIRTHANFIIRPEVRHDWNPANDFDQTTFGIDAILTF